MNENDVTHNKPLTEQSSGVQGHLQILQGVIQRMAANCNSCKAWCVGIVSAILVLVADKEAPRLVWLALVPTVLFFSLDAYYLALEKAFRASYNGFVRKLHSEKVFVDDLFSVTPKGEMSKHQVAAIASFSVWGFYGGLALLVFIAYEMILSGI